VLTAVLIVLVVLVAVAYAAVPLLAPGQVDPLPSERDPVLQDLEEDREALFRAIRELDARDDVATAAREGLRARYEAKAAVVLRAIDARRAQLGEEAPDAPASRAPRRGVPWPMVGLLGVMAASAMALGPFVLPRVGQNATVTTFFADDLRAAEALRDLQRAAERDPGVATFMSLADAYWQLDDAPAAEGAYRRVLLEAEAGGGAAPALAYKRLAQLAVATDLGVARDYLVAAREADPSDPETLYALGEIAFATGELDMAAHAFRAYLATPAGGGDAEAADRLALVERLAPALAALAQDRSAATLGALADVLWSEGAIDQAVEIYFELLTQHDASDTVALARVGQMLFLRGRGDDAIGVLERAAAAAGGLDRLEPQASLFLGNAYFSAGDDANAIRAWEAHVAIVGEAEAGRVPGLIATAEARRRGEAPPVSAALPDGAPSVSSALDRDAVATGAAPGPATSGQAIVAAPDPARVAAALTDPALLVRVGAELYAAHCAVCHGAAAGGGVGPRLAGNARAANEANVRSAITFGRGLMPGFGPVLTGDEIEVLVRWLASEVAALR
jgi:mono/diheme cytochrome c family protein